ncbi:MAG TPA: hypothetical protein EYG31_06830 [Porticoccaceae bacterium]|jgi:hypothetical protein|nr:hypothetical protein [Gammaproteobacteria bacterium]HIL60335.1 hypothetical protein [Porticoccaceae bacterium]
MVKTNMPLRSIMGAGALASMLITPVVLAGGTIEFGENKSVTVGAGLRTAYTSIDDSSDFDVQSLRLYMSGQAHEKIKFTFNTECTACVFGQDSDHIGNGGDIDVLDAIVQFELSPGFNIWAGRMLTPADRIEMNGPYYGLSWNQYTVPLLPSDQLGQAGLLGRDDGVTVWGALGKFQYAVGAFDGVEGGPNQDDNVLLSARFAYNFLSMESNPGYYSSSTYYGGGGDIFTLGLSLQSQADGTGTAMEAGDFDAIILDGLFEKVLGNNDVLTIEGEIKSMDADLSATALTDPTCFCLFDGDSSFVTAAYLFNSGEGFGKFQPYIRYTKNEPNAGLDSDLSEIGLNYIIDGHNLRLNINWTSGDANLTGARGADVDGLSVGFQIQL